MDQDTRLTSLWLLWLSLHFVAKRYLHNISGACTALVVAPTDLVCCMRVGTSKHRASQNIQARKLSVEFLDDQNL
ncbi:uncharacterized protein BO95DRAFT_446104, partial [Aspergillus brunneoviolaceus CBS 621.78]